jgi:hypothetical protein
VLRMTTIQSLKSMGFAALSIPLAEIDGLRFALPILLAGL